MTPPPAPVTVHKLRICVRSGAYLAAWMAFRGHSMRSLARRVGCSHQMIGHLCSGHLTTCSPTLAAKIEAALDVPSGTIFVPFATTANMVSGRPVGRRGRAAS